MRVNLVVAASKNDVIGRDGDLPWRLPADLKHFKAITMGHPIVMGRATWDSIGRALPGRRNIVLTRQANFEAEGAITVSSPAAALEAAGDAEEVMIIGGGQVYDLFLPIAERIFMTRVKIETDGDTRFPPIETERWRIVGSAPGPADDIAFDFEIWERKL